MDVLIIGANPTENRSLFENAESLLKKQGHNAINPLLFQTSGLRESFQLMNYTARISMVQAVYFLPNYFELPYAGLLQGLAKGMELKDLSHSINNEMFHKVD